LGHPKPKKWTNRLTPVSLKAKQLQLETSKRIYYLLDTLDTEYHSKTFVGKQGFLGFSIS